MLISFLLTVSMGWSAPDISKQKYSGTAKAQNGTTAYLEKHDVVFSESGNILNSSTEYQRANGEPIGRLVSDYRQSVTAPEYTFEDLRDSSTHGLEFKDGVYKLWKKNKNEVRQEKVIDAKSFDPGALVVGCQGLHYYLIKNLDRLDRKGSTPIKYLIPGKLDYFSFLLNIEREDDDHIYLKVRVENLFLRVFVSSLKMKYRKKDRRLLEYVGVSNIPDDQGSLQNIALTYQY